MSTRGWYEYHVLNPRTHQRTLAMQFYKWGDATAENALQEWRLLQTKIEANDGLLPIVWLDDLLREQLGELYPRLPEQFSVAAFLFLIQRAQEERSPFKGRDYRELLKEQRPDYRLGFATGKAMVKNGFLPLEHSDLLLNDVLWFIGVGHFVRPWREYGLTWSVLEWLQYLTQVTMTKEMGSIAGYLSAPRDTSMRYRYFIWIDPVEPFRITRLAVELGERGGGNPLAVEEIFGPDETPDAYYARENAAKLQRLVEELGVDLCTLEKIAGDYSEAPDLFWGPRCHDRPALTDAMVKTLRVGTSYL